MDPLNAGRMLKEQKGLNNWIARIFFWLNPVQQNHQWLRWLDHSNPKKTCRKLHLSSSTFLASISSLPAPTDPRNPPRSLIPIPTPVTWARFKTLGWHYSDWLMTGSLVMTLAYTIPNYMGGSWYPTTMGFPTKNDHFGVFGGTTI